MSNFDASCNAIYYRSFSAALLTLSSSTSLKLFSFSCNYPLNSSNYLSYSSIFACYAIPFCLSSITSACRPFKLAFKFSMSSVFLLTSNSIIFVFSSLLSKHSSIYFRFSFVNLFSCSRHCTFNSFYLISSSSPSKDTN